MVSKSQIKLIKSLSQKKHRTKNQLFFVEGRKGINEQLNSGFKLHSLFTSEDIFSAPANKTFFISNSELSKISALKTPQTALAIFKFPKEKEVKEEGLILALDGIRDPGNLGTIIRLCDWFGIEDLLCSRDTVDCYNPKVVQATMGSIARINILYVDLSEFLKSRQDLPLFGAFMDGENVYKQDLPKKGILVLGNEANGISVEIEQLLHRKLAIPRFGKFQKTESLNVATATAILLSEFKRISTATGR